MRTPPMPHRTVSQSGMLSRSPGATNLPSSPMMTPAISTPMMSMSFSISGSGTTTAQQIPALGTRDPGNAPGDHERRPGDRSSASLEPLPGAPRHLLEDQRVAVGVGEPGVPDPAAAGLVDLADVHPAPGELGAGLVDVGDDQVQALDAAGRHLGDLRQPGPDDDRTGRRGRGQLDDPDAVRRADVDVRHEAELAGVEGLGSVDVRDRDRDEL